MSIDWVPRESEEKNHDRYGSEHWGTKAPCTIYEKRPLKDPKGNVVPGLYVAWVMLNNPAQYNSYTTEMVKGVIAGMENSSTDRSVICTIFTGTGPNAFCTGGNTKEYSEYYSRRPEEYGAYMELFNNMVDAIL
jgi:6-oxo-cyclohex-1-ene-carbonyl-CoA hydrolase